MRSFGTPRSPGRTRRFFRGISDRRPLRDRPCRGSSHRTRVTRPRAGVFGVRHAARGAVAGVGVEVLGGWRALLGHGCPIRRNVGQVSSCMMVSTNTPGACSTSCVAASQSGQVPECSTGRSRGMPKALRRFMAVCHSSGVGSDRLLRRSSVRRIQYMCLDVKCVLCVLSVLFSAHS